MRKALTREGILDKAVELLDREGLSGLSMRKLGTALGVEAMSLYNHVESKDALLDGIHERILLSLEPPPATRSWQAFIRHQAHALHRALLVHPHAIPLFATRPASTPAAIERLDHYLRTLLAAGFKPIDTLSIVQLVAQLVVGHTMWTNGLEMIVLASQIDQVERVIEKWNPDRELALGVDALIHGFEQLLA